MNCQPKTEFQELYLQSKHQLSALMFLEDEMKFLKGLMHRFFLPIIQDLHINRVQLINSNFRQLCLVKSNVTKELLIHQGELFSHTNGVLSRSIEFLRLVNERIEAELKDLNRSLKNIKKELFVVYKELPSRKQNGITSSKPCLK